MADSQFQVHKKSDQKFPGVEQHSRETGVGTSASAISRFPRTRTRTQSSSSSSGGGAKYSPKRRPPPKSDIKFNDVYIGEKSKFRSQLEKCKKLLDGGQKDVYLHGLGNSIPRALNIALELKNFYQGTLDFSSTTSTVKLIDDLIPEDDSTLPSYSVRNVSSVKVHLFRSVKIP